MNSKLVRDNTPDIIRHSGRDPQIHVADQNEFSAKLKEKLEEEIKEYTTNENVEELADILEVVYAIAETKHVTQDELEKMRTSKAQKNGSFSKKIILDTIAE